MVNTDKRTLAAWWTACFLWSGTFLAIRIGVADVAPLTFAWSRLVIALAILGPLALASRPRTVVGRRDLAQLIAAGVLLLGVNYALLYWGAQHVASGLIAILQSATPVFALGLGAVTRTERVTLRKSFAAAAGMLGVALIFGSEAHAARGSGHMAVLGAGAVAGSALCVAGAYVWIKGFRGRVAPLTVTSVQCAAGLITLAPLALALEGSPFTAGWTPEAIAALLYLAVGGSTLAFWLNYWLLARMDASAMLMMGIAEVPIAVALGALLLGERLPPGTLVGGLCVLLSVVATLRSPPAAAVDVRK